MGFQRLFVVIKTGMCMRYTMMGALLMDGHNKPMILLNPPRSSLILKGMVTLRYSSALVLHSNGLSLHGIMMGPWLMAGLWKTGWRLLNHPWEIWMVTVI